MKPHPSFILLEKPGVPLTDHNFSVTLLVSHGTCQTEKKSLYQTLTQKSRAKIHFVVTEALLDDILRRVLQQGETHTTIRAEWGGVK